MAGRSIPTNGVELWVELDGPSGGDAVVLLGGADASVLRWPAPFVEGLAEIGCTVVRIEHRDTGRSTWIDEEHPYRLEDLAADAAGVIDAMGLGPVHVVGYSMGGAVAQLLALEHPGRIRSMCLVASTPGMGDERLPEPDERFVERMAARHFEAPPPDHEGRVAWVVELYRWLAGERYPFAEDEQHRLADVEVRRAWRPESGHGWAATASPSRLDRLGEISVPVVVVHGTADPVYPLAHGEALASGIPGARLVVVEGLGHELPAAFGDELLAVLVELFGRS